MCMLTYMFYWHHKAQKGLSLCNALPELPKTDKEIRWKREYFSHTRFSFEVRVVSEQENKRGGPQFTGSVLPVTKLRLSVRQLWAMPCL